MLDIVVCALIGLGIGIVELSARHRPAPRQLWATPATLGYLGVNAAVPLIVLAMARVFGWTFGVDPASPSAVRWMQVIASGAAGVIVLRCSALWWRVGGVDAPVGPAAILVMLLTHVDDAAARLQARRRDRLIDDLLDGLPLETARSALAAQCVALSGGATEPARLLLEARLQHIAAMPDEEAQRVRLIGLALIDATSESALIAAARSLRRGRAR